MWAPRTLPATGTQHPNRRSLVPPLQELETKQSCPQAGAGALSAPHTHTQACTRRQGPDTTTQGPQTGSHTDHISPRRLRSGRHSLQVSLIHGSTWGHAQPSTPPSPLIPPGRAALYPETCAHRARAPVPTGPSWYAQRHSQGCPFSPPLGRPPRQQNHPQSHGGHVC